MRNTDVFKKQKLKALVYVYGIVWKYCVSVYYYLCHPQSSVGRGEP